MGESDHDHNYFTLFLNLCSGVLVLARLSFDVELDEHGLFVMEYEAFPELIYSVEE